MGFHSGIKSYQRLAAAQTVAASTVLVVLGANTTNNSFSVPVNANTGWHFKLKMLFTLGATGGFKFQWVVPAAPTSFAATWIVEDTVTPAQIVAEQVASAAFANALAVAGTHFVDAELDIVNGVNAGTVSFQFACNSAANSIIAVLGTEIEATQF